MMTVREMTAHADSALHALLIVDYSVFFFLSRIRRKISNSHRLVRKIAKVLIQQWEQIRGHFSSHKQNKLSALIILPVKVLDLFSAYVVKIFKMSVASIRVLF